MDRSITDSLQRALAKLDEKHWQDIEGARTNPTVASLVGVARALKVPLSGLFESSSEAERPSGCPPGRAPARARALAGSGALAASRSR